MPDKLFVYGTLQPGGSMHHLLSAIGGEWDKGTVRGELIQAGDIPGFPYPGVVLNDEDDTIPGYLFTSENLSAHWDKLDRYEGSRYKRVITEVTLTDGQTVKASIYELKSDKT